MILGGGERTRIIGGERVNYDEGRFVIVRSKRCRKRWEQGQTVPPPEYGDGLGAGNRGKSGSKVEHFRATSLGISDKTKFVTKSIQD